MKDLLEAIEDSTDDMVNALCNMCRIPAIAPQSGGDGEAKKAQFLITLLKESGMEDIELVNAEDKRVSAGYRPNIIATVKGTDRTLPPLWIISHMDVVPEGDKALWKSEPFNPIVKDGRIIGRGVEDNGGALIASIFAVKSILALGLKPRRDIKLVFVADEEVGSKYGIKYLMEKGIFTKEDLILVPDYGTPDGTIIEVVEKAHLQVRVQTKGKQVHSSRPTKGINALRAASRYLDRVTTTLYETYSTEDELFSPPISTFEPTKREANVPNVNTVPGEDAFYMDCRILPSQDLNEIIGVMKDVSAQVEMETGATIDLANIKATPAPSATPVDSEIVKNLKKAITEVTGKEAEPKGIGGGTCAAIFREKGYPAAVWAVSDETAHEPNESIKIGNLVIDAKVFAVLAMM